jgi:hypothetical protein
MADKSALLRDIDRYLKRSKMTVTAFGYLACGDPGFVRKVREGRVPRDKTVGKIRKFIERKDK